MAEIPRFTAECYFWKSVPRLNRIAMLKYRSLIRKFVHPLSNFASTLVQGGTPGALRYYCERSYGWLEFKGCESKSARRCLDSVGSEVVFPQIYEACAKAVAEAIQRRVVART